MTAPASDRYEAAALIERLAIGEVGERRESARASILRGGADALEAIRYARIAVCDQVVALDRAITALGLDA
ncbi:MAG TPA: hypothetical protein VHZ96_26370 [Frankiaceae bacterium]|nr:hypothetical protein [Frankiaceae bacterium]